MEILDRCTSTGGAENFVSSYPLSSPSLDIGRGHVAVQDLLGAGAAAAQELEQAQGVGGVEASVGLDVAIGKRLPEGRRDDRGRIHMTLGLA